MKLATWWLSFGCHSTASDMASKLRGLVFAVIGLNNLVINQIGNNLREFRSKLAPGSVGLFITKVMRSKRFLSSTD